ncbi:hypothetical protein E2C01_086537 [Portunus trituberculatus]|uniref:Uncharacterized protein n=1 Tax=Portunus trituberculatus TaxID=210409 RepID=A0A5B7JBR0_PORTR|nr:hypothetical protein [Portunus trituberculatus]
MGRGKADQAARVIRGAETGPDPAPEARRDGAGRGGTLVRQEAMHTSFHGIILYSVFHSTLREEKLKKECNVIH